MTDAYDAYGLGMSGGGRYVVLLWTLPNYLLQMVGAALLVVSTIQRRRW